MKELVKTTTETRTALYDYSPLPCHDIHSPHANHPLKAGSASHHQPSNGNAAASASGWQSASLPPLPPGKEIPPGVTCTDAISRTLNTLPPSQLLDILTQMKSLATTDPTRATELLTQAPQLAYAVFQALLLMGLVSPEAINSVLETGGVAPPPSAPPVQPPSANQMHGGYPGATNTPPVAVGGGYAPPPAQAPAPAAALGGGQDPEALMQAVMALPQETIDLLPEAERAQVLALRATFAAQRR